MKKFLSYKGEVDHVAPNLLNRDFRTKKPNQKWATDGTGFRLLGQRLYLSPIPELHSTYLVRYVISDYPAEHGL